MLTPNISSPRHRRGFTLIELLTVIAIIGILAAILIPTVGKVRQRANYSRSLSQLRQIGNALNMYAMDHKGFYPAPAGGPNSWANEISRKNNYLGPVGLAQGSTVMHPELVAPGVKYDNPQGATNLTYCATGTMCGIMPGGFLNVTLSRSTNRVLAPSQAMLVFLARQRAAGDGFSRVVASNWTDAQIQSDLTTADLRDTALFNFDLGTSVPVLMADGSVRGYSQADLREVDPLINWQGGK